MRPLGIRPERPFVSIRSIAAWSLQSGFPYDSRRRLSFVSSVITSFKNFEAITIIGNQPIKSRSPTVAVRTPKQKPARRNPLEYRLPKLKALMLTNPCGRFDRSRMRQRQYNRWQFSRETFVPIFNQIRHGKTLRYIIRFRRRNILMFLIMTSDI